jgi:hypothetical protein
MAGMSSQADTSALLLSSFSNVFDHHLQNRQLHQQKVQHRIRLCNEVVVRGKAANAANFTDHNIKQDIGRFFTK